MQIIKELKFVRHRKKREGSLFEKFLTITLKTLLKLNEFETMLSLFEILVVLHGTQAKTISRNKEKKINSFFIFFLFFTALTTLGRFTICADVHIWDIKNEQIAIRQKLNKKSEVHIVSQG